MKYKNSSGTEIHSDTVKYTFIAADCGDQPTTEEEDIYAWSDIAEDWIPISNFKQRYHTEVQTNHDSLIRCEWSITDNLTPRPWSGDKRCNLKEYNCIACSVDETDFWYNEWDIDQDFGNNNDVFEDSDMDDFYMEIKDWSPITSGSDEEKAAQAEAMYYSYDVPWDYGNDDPRPGPGYHAARRRNCGCGAGKWIMYESKMGTWEEIEHVWDQLNDSLYGTPTRFYK